MSITITGLTPMFEVFDMPTSLKFYCDVLGFEIVSSSSPPPNCGWAMVKKDGHLLMFNTMYDPDGERPDKPDAARAAAHGDASIYFGCADADAIYDALRTKGLDVGPPAVAYYGMKQLYLKDPDGYVLCFQHSA